MQKMSIREKALSLIHHDAIREIEQSGILDTAVLSSYLGVNEPQDKFTRIKGSFDDSPSDKPLMFIDFGLRGENGIEVIVWFEPTEAGQPWITSDRLPYPPQPDKHFAQVQTSFFANFRDGALHLDPIGGDYSPEQHYISDEVINFFKDTYGLSTEAQPDLVE